VGSTSVSDLPPFRRLLLFLLVVLSEAAVILVVGRPPDRWPEFA